MTVVSIAISERTDVDEQVLSSRMRVDVVVVGTWDPRTLINRGSSRLVLHGGLVAGGLTESLVVRKCTSG